MAVASAPECVADPTRPRRLVLGAGAGIEAAVACALRLAGAPGTEPLVLLAVQPPLAFRARPSTILVPGMPAGVLAAHPLLDAQGIPSRIAAADADLPGCHDGDLASLASLWLAAQGADATAAIEAFLFGPPAQLAGIAALLQEHRIPARPADA